MTQSNPNHLLTVHEVAQILRVDPTTVRRWIEAGIFPAIELPHKRKRTAYRIAPETIDALLGNMQPVAGKRREGQV